MILEKCGTPYAGRYALSITDTDLALRDIMMECWTCKI